MRNDQISGETPAPGHEDSAPSLRNVFIIASSVLLMAALCLVTSDLTMRRLSKKRPMQPMQPLGLLVAPDNRPLTRLPAPTLELDDGHADFTALKERQEQELNSYGWVDRSRGIVRIPIDRAMDLTAARGFPVMTNQGPPRGQLTLPARP